LSLRLDLLRGDAKLGVITRDPDASDFPWHVGSLERAPAYETVRQLFEEQERLLDLGEVGGRLDQVHAAILAPGIRLRSEAGDLIPVDGITVAGARVSWR
jgi:hypothetical protein